MLKALIKKQFTEIFRSFFIDQKKNTARSKGATVAFFILFALLMVFAFGITFGSMALLICEPLVSAGYNWMYFMFATLTATIFGVFGSAFNTAQSLYLANDNDFLLSMPIPVSRIMLSRLIGVYIMGAIYSGFIYIPAAVVYWIFADHSVLTVISGLLMFIVITFFVLALSCLLGWVVAKVMVRLKNNGILTAILAILLFAVFYFFYGRMTSMAMSIISNADSINSSVGNGPLHIIGNAPTGDYVSLLIVALVVAVICALVWLLLSKTFIGITTVTNDVRNSKYTNHDIVSRSVPSSLLSREFKSLTSNSLYMLNGSLSSVILVVMGIAVLVAGFTAINDIRSFLSITPFPASILALFAALIISLISGLNMTIVPSISLEGKNFWILRTMPIEAEEIIKAKVKMQLILTMIPTLFCALCFLPLLIGSGAEPGYIVFVFLIPLSYNILCVLFGLMLGIKFANLNWVNMAVPIKQSGAVTIYSLTMMFAPILFGAGAVFLSISIGLLPVLLIVLAIFIILSVILFVWLKKRGMKAFEELSC